MDRRFVGRTPLTWPRGSDQQSREALMNFKAFGLSVVLAGVVVGCSGSPSETGKDQVAHDDKQVGKATSAVVDIHPCSWAEMDAAQSACDANHTVQARSYATTCTITACNASSTMIYYSYVIQ
jgi:hypothetical protein